MEGKHNLNEFAEPKQSLAVLPNSDPFQLAKDVVGAPTQPKRKSKTPTATSVAKLPKATYALRW